MENLRRWEMDRSVPFNFQIASDARFSRTDYVDDQVWKLNLGSRDNPALAFQTQFGGRAGLASIVPMWILEGRTVYQYQTYAKPPIVTHFAPGYLRTECTIVPELELVAQYWAMESRASGGEYLLTNVSNEDIYLHLDLFGHVAINNRNRKLNVLTFPDDTIALHLGQIGEINPVVTLEGASLSVYGGYISSPKIGCKVDIPAGETVRIPFVVAGLSEMRDSVSLAMNWLARPWTPFLEQINLEATTIPQISTGNDSWDKLLDLSFTHLVNSFMKPTDNLPHASFVATRASNRGWSKRGDGTDHIRVWAGQDPTLAYLITPVIANIEPNFAKGIIHNYLATQDESGFVDRQPGLGGQRQGIMMMPILARLTLMIYQQTEDEQFLADTFPKLRAFFKRWFNHDLDNDGDGIPEWNSERQTGYVAFPTFAMGQVWGQGANIRQMETPDLLAYLISEADALHTIAETLGDKKEKASFTKQRKQLEKHLKTFWDGKRYTYRDRDSHITTDSVTLLEGVAGDETYTLDQSLVAPNRVVIRVVGGVSHRPRITLHLKGKDENSNPIAIEAQADDFLWLNRQGMYTTPQAFSHIDTLKIDGLSRVYKIYAETIDSSRLDINHLIPLWTGRLTKSHAKLLVKLATDEQHFMRPNGLTMVSALDKDFDASNAHGGGGIWMYWLSLIGEGMVKSGYRDEATQLIKKVLDNLTKNLTNDGHLSQFYHADETQGFGEDGHIGGIVPLNLLTDIIGIRIISGSKVWVGGDFTWGQDITVRQHGVTVTRSVDAILIRFPSDHEITLEAEPKWQAVIDPKPVKEEPTKDPELPELPDIIESESTKRVMIEIDGNEDREESTKTVVDEAIDKSTDTVETETEHSEPPSDSQPDDT
jgi:hypothetical protein